MAHFLLNGQITDKEKTNLCGFASAECPGNAIPSQGITSSRILSPFGADCGIGQHRGQRAKNIAENGISACRESDFI